MSEWWTYRLSNFLMFSPRTYYRLFDLYNAAIWPAQLVAIVFGLAILALCLRGGAWRGRFVAAILAGCWLWIAIAFHWSRYTTINWGARYFAGIFILESALLVWTGVVRGRLIFQTDLDAVGRSRLWIFVFALVVEPLIGPVLGRGWRSVEIFGLAPDPTAVATLGVLLPVRGGTRWELITVPTIWCAISGATLWAMKSPDAWVVPLAGALALSLAIHKTRASQRKRQTQRNASARVPDRA